MGEPPTVARALAEGTSRLAAAGIDSPALDAALLLAHSLGISRAQLITRQAESLSSAQYAAWRHALDRRAEHEPVSHILGYREFWEWPFRVTSAVLDPRPDSETLIEAAVALFPDKTTSLRILDLGTGSGCLLISLLKIFLNSLGTGVDVYYNALQVAVDNAHRLNVGNRANWVCGDWCKALALQYDLVVSNPPYIAEAEKSELARSVVDYEPHGALFGGADGLECYRILAGSIRQNLTPNGKVLVEIGIGQAEPVEAIFGHEGWRPIGRWKDLGGIERILGFEQD